MRFKAIYLIIFSLWAFEAYAETLEVCGDLKQGELVLIKDLGAVSFAVYENVGIEEIKQNILELKHKDYPVSDDGIILVALHRDAPKKMTFGSYPGSDAGSFYEVNIAPTKWDVQQITGVSGEKVNPSKEAEEEILRERRELGRVLSKITKGDSWRRGFIVPVNGKISGSFGNQRIFNGIPKNPHTGADIAAPLGTPVKAAGDGVVVLSGQDYFYTGNMVVIDHGQGLQTIYAHLRDATVKENDAVKKGDVIGHVGKTGRATGAHLHWGASLNNIRFNPYSLLDINEKSCIFIKGVYSGDVIEQDIQ